jgi:hypothetical protein
MFKFLICLGLLIILQTPLHEEIIRHKDYAEYIVKELKLTQAVIQDFLSYEGVDIQRIKQKNITIQPNAVFPTNRERFNYITRKNNNTFNECVDIFKRLKSENARVARKKSDEIASIKSKIENGNFSLKTKLDEEEKEYNSYNKLVSFDNNAVIGCAKGHIEKDFYDKEEEKNNSILNKQIELIHEAIRYFEKPIIF